ncbi:hypothetical protein V8E54_000305 [Elaphomyces granulatus]
MKRIIQADETRGWQFRDSSDQSNFSQAVLSKHPSSHLYTSTDTIFGAGSFNELFSWRNSLILHKVIEAALDKGVIAIVPLLRPNTRFEKTKQLRKDIEAGELTANDCQKLKEECIKLRDEISQEDNEKLLEDKNLVRLWEKTEPKEYMNITTHSSLVNILLREILRSNVPPSLLTGMIKSSRPSRFRIRATSVPDKRAAESMLCLVDVLESNDEGDATSRRTNYQSYLTTRIDQLRGFVEELGQDIDSIPENRLEDDNNDPHPDPDPEALGVIAAENFRANPIKEDFNDEDLY